MSPAPLRRLSEPGGRASSFSVADRRTIQNTLDIRAYLSSIALAIDGGTTRARRRIAGHRLTKDGESRANASPTRGPRLPDGGLRPQEHLPETHATRAFAARHRGHVFMNFFSESQRGSAKWDHDAQTVLVNRTEALDASRSRP